MIWDYTENLLLNKGFQKIAAAGTLVDFFCRIEDNGVYVCGVVKNAGGQVTISTQLHRFTESLQKELDKRLSMHGYKKTEIFFIIFSDNFARDKVFATQDIEFWLIDVRSRRLMIFENQPQDYYGIKEELEKSLEESYEENRVHKVPIITTLLIVVNIIVYVILEIAGSTQDSLFMLENGAANWHLIFYEGQIYRLFTCMFLHFGAVHLVNNMFMLGIIGSRFENEIGKAKFAIIYFVSGIFASIASSCFYMILQDYAICAGASGAIFGIFGAYVAMIIKKKRRTDITGPGFLIVLVLIACSGAMSGGIDFVAHLGGLMAGVIGGLIFSPKDSTDSSVKTRKDNNYNNRYR
ncbi:MAG: rhomboid family intramembrane serine protease [Eubacterium sp.]